MTPRVILVPEKLVFGRSRVDACPPYLGCVGGLDLILRPDCVPGPACLLLQLQFGEGHAAYPLASFRTASSAEHNRNFDCFFYIVISEYGCNDFDCIFLCLHKRLLLFLVVREVLVIRPCVISGYSAQR